MRNKKKIKKLQKKVIELSDEIYILKNTLFDIQFPPKFKKGDIVYCYNEDDKNIEVYEVVLSNISIESQSRYYKTLKSSLDIKENDLFSLEDMKNKLIEISKQNKILIFQSELNQTGRIKQLENFYKDLENSRNKKPINPQP